MQLPPRHTYHSGHDLDIDAVAGSLDQVEVRVLGLGEQVEAADLAQATQEAPHVVGGLEACERLARGLELGHVLLIRDDDLAGDVGEAVEVAQLALTDEQGKALPAVLRGVGCGLEHAAHERVDLRQRVRECGQLLAVGCEVARAHGVAVQRGSKLAVDAGHTRGERDVLLDKQKHTATAVQRGLVSCWSGSRRQQGVRTFMAASASTTLLSTSRMRFSNTSSSLALNQRMEQPWLSTPTTRPTPSCKRTHVSNLCTKGASKCTWRARSAAAAAPVAAGRVAVRAVMWWACSTWHRAWARQEGSHPPHCPASANNGEHVLHAARCAAKQGSSGTYHRASDGHAHSRASRDGTTAGHHRGHTASKGAEHRALGVGGGREKTNQPPTFRQPVARGIARLNFGTKSRPASVAGCQRRSMRSEREP